MFYTITNNLKSIHDMQLGREKFNLIHFWLKFLDLNYPILN